MIPVENHSFPLAVKLPETFNFRISGFDWSSDTEMFLWNCFIIEL
jgi:hypothetical protein